MPRLFTACLLAGLALAAPMAGGVQAQTLRFG